MRLKFKVQQYQTDATDAVCDAFEGQPNQGAAAYLRDLGTLPARGGMDALFEAADFQQSLEEGLRQRAREAHRRRAPLQHPPCGEMQPARRVRDHLP
ncbi:MAG: hypothetical protein ACFWTL_12190 [Atopobium sp.]